MENIIKEKRKIFRRITLEWYDAETDDSWVDIEDVLKISNLPKITTRGWLISQQKGLIIVCHSIAEDGDCMGILRIPKPWIIKKEIEPKGALRVQQKTKETKRVTKRVTKKRSKKKTK